MIGSVLTATIIEARELKSAKLAGSTNPYVVLSIEGQTSQTEQVSNKTDPVWNEIMMFDITHGREPLVIQIFDRSDLIGKDQLLGECLVNLDIL
jgi:Ca2+-dependent lipid-binding protein